MKRIFLVLLVLMCLKSNSQCPNGDVEQGSFNNFTRLQGTFPQPLNLLAINPTPVQTGVPLLFRQQVVNVPSGPHTQADITVPQITLTDEGVYCIRINNYGQQKQKDAVYYTFQVTPSNFMFKFKYAMVLQDPGHPASDQPFVNIFMNVLYNCPGKTIPHVATPPSFNNFGCPNFYFNEKILDFNLYNSTYLNKVANTTDPFFKQGPDQTVYKNWQCVQYNLSAYIGKTVSLCVIAAACNQGGHYGYVYLDGLCKANLAVANFQLTNTSFCSTGTSILNGASSTGEDRYFIEIAQSDQAGNLIPNGDSKSWWTLGVEVPNGINLKNEYINRGGVWKCNSFYKVKLAVMNDCAPWNEKSQVIKYTCAEIQPTNQFGCCPSKVQGTPCFNLVVPNPQPGFTYNWTSTSPSGFTGSGPNVQYCGKKSNLFQLTAIGPDGCVSTAIYTVFIQGNIQASLSQVNVNQSCGSELGCNNPPVSVSYNPIPCEEGQSEIFNPLMQNNIFNYWVTYPLFNYVGSGNSFLASVGGNYAAVVQNSCKQVILPFTAVVKSLHTPTLIAPNTIAPNSSIPLNQKLIISDLNTNAPNFGQGPAYGKAVDFELRVFDRFGGLFRVIHKSDIGLGPNDCLKQGDIQWNGKDAAGNIVPQGVYTFCVLLKLCDGSWYNWDVNTGGSTIACIRECRRWIWRWPFVQTYCCESCGFAKHVTVLP